MPYLQSRSLDEALAELSAAPLAVVAGGTDFFPAERMRQRSRAILDISRTEGLRGIARVPGGWRIGATSTWSEVARADLPPAAFALYAGTILWVIAYDTIYAHQDREDDAIVGVKSTALLFGACTRPILAGFYGAALILFAGAFVLEEVGTAAWIGLCFAAGQLYWQVTTLDIDDGENCLRRFKSNRGFGLILCAGLLADWIGAYALP